MSYEFQPGSLALWRALDSYLYVSGQSCETVRRGCVCEVLGTVRRGDEPHVRLRLGNTESTIDIPYWELFSDFEPLTRARTH